MPSPLAVAVAGLVLACAAPVSASASAAPLDATAVLRQAGLTYQDSAGYLGAEGPAADVRAAAARLAAGRVGNTAFYTGPDETGIGFLVVSGDGLPPTTDFQVADMTAVNVENNSDQLDAVYADDGGELDATVPPGTDADVYPVDIDYAAYPPGYQPPPDNRGLNPTARFEF
ncbi:MAG TPA: hypothetical protein VL551_25985 [Actinospica sp.]|jgi:hypothetical protein|nr:hypothetical protein [Actinospica sp.]